MHQEEDCVSIGGSIFQDRVEGPGHDQYEDIMRHVQKAPGDISWTIDRAEFDELSKCAGNWASSSLTMLTSFCWNVVLFPNTVLKVGLSLSLSLRTLLTTKG